VQLAVVADPASRAVLSFKLFVIVLVGGALVPAGAIAVPCSVPGRGGHDRVARECLRYRGHELLAAIVLLGVVSLLGEVRAGGGSGSARAWRLHGLPGAASRRAASSSVTAPSSRRTMSPSVRHRGP
jgi:hypothetical protein